MTTIKGYKLVCEWCGCESESLWGIGDPNNTLLTTNDGMYIPIYTDTVYHPVKTPKPKVYLPEGWLSKQLRRDKWIDTPTTTTVQVGIWKRKVDSIKSRLNSEYKYIYFDCESCKNNYERFKKNCSEDWE